MAGQAYQLYKIKASKCRMREHDIIYEKNVKRNYEKVGSELQAMDKKSTKTEALYRQIKSLIETFLE